MHDVPAYKKKLLSQFYLKSFKGEKKGGGDYELLVVGLLNDLHHDFRFYITDYNSLLIGRIIKIIFKCLPRGVIT